MDFKLKPEDYYHPQKVKERQDRKSPLLRVLQDKEKSRQQD